MLLVLTAVCALAFVAGALYDLRRFSNAVFLGLTLLLLTLQAMLTAQSNSGSHTVVILSELMLVVLGPVVLTSFLLANGVRMLRKEGGGLGNRLSLLAGLGALFLTVQTLTALALDLPQLYMVSGALLLPAAYFGFLFSCFLLYGHLYGRLGTRGRLDYIVVLGSGLVGGSRVPPLLASRLDRAHALYRQQIERHGSTPLLVTSGGQGPDEDLPEAHAMAGYLVDHGVPDEHILREDASRTTEENLRFSRKLMEATGSDYRCAIVTNNFHVLRAGFLARRVGVRGHSLGAPTARYFLPSAMLREFTGVVWSAKYVHGIVCFLLLGAYLATFS
ncbi:YdcF family protein [Streptomyces sp. AC627_RSS907]|uniref:YdcF family protein n=1 Tax=Streptomyces sp. AC627_RSS907 TaxID=2823684 RepID=UPI001C23EE1E|nr:YdcF family protein [Streptomyces sp. AC627_RSS907]